MDWKLSPNALITPQELRSHVRRASTADEEALNVAANWTTAILESRTRRRLRERVYFFPFNIACTTTNESPNIGGTTFNSKLKVGLDAFGSGLGFGSRVKTITSDTAAALTEKATATGSPTITFGTVCLYADVDGSTEILLQEHPCQEVYSVKSRDRDGLKTDVDLTGISIDNEAGIIALPYGALPCGLRNIEVECRAGYRPRSETDPGHEEWSELFGLALGVAEVLFQRHSKALGAAVETMGGTEKVKIPEVELPVILESTLKMFERGIE